MPTSDSTTLTKICTKCGIEYPATSAYFSRSKTEKYGLKARCKRCTATSAGYTFSPREVVPEGMKRCTECHELKPATTEHFFKRSDIPSGLSSHCKPCVANASHDTQAAKTAQRKAAIAPIVDEPGEEWRDIPGYEDLYQVSNRGNVRRKFASRIRYPVNSLLTATVTPQGYVTVRLLRNGYQRIARIHQLVMQAFVGQCPAGMEVNHKNGIKDDNRPENLEYVTPKQNTQHARDVLGAFQDRKGEQNIKAKLTEDDVRTIRKELAEGVSARTLAQRYSVDPCHIRLIKRRKVWAHVE